MATAQAIDEPIILSGDLESVETGPEPDGELVLKVEEFFEATRRANIAVVENGVNRAVIKPTITTISDSAACMDLVDLLHEIAWSHCTKVGKRTRYCCQLFTAVEGRARLKVERAYFTLSPEGQAVEETGVQNQTEFNLGLQNFALRCLDRQSIAAHRTQMREASTHRLANESLAELRHAVRAVASSKVEEIRATGQEKRKDALNGAIFSILPALAIKKLGLDAEDLPADEKPTNGTAKKQLSAQKPIERVRDFLTGSELAALEAALGRERWQKCEAATDVKTIKGCLIGLEEAEAQAVYNAVPGVKLAEMAGWAQAAGE